jgi:5-methylthioadenosine/S-adenosylhomocysteine deaminase
VAGEALIVKGGYVVTGDGAGTIHENADIVIERGRIAAIGPGAGLSRSGEVIDARRVIAMPGLINAHIHSNEGFQQGAYDNLPLEVWLGESYPPFGFPIHTPRDYYLRTMLAAVESIRAGVTTVQDDYVHPPATREAYEAALQAYDEIGIRAWFAIDMWDVGLFDCLPYMRELIPPGLQAEIMALPMATARQQIELFEDVFARWHGRRERIRIIIAPCGPQRCSDALLREIDGLSARHGIPIHSHTLETRLQAVHSRMRWDKTAVAHFDDLGLLTPRLTLVHAIWLTDDDIARIAGAGASVVHNPLSNLKLGSGICPVRKLLDAGVNVALGTDGLATSDTADLVEAIRVASLIHKTGTPDYGDWVGAAEVFRMATRGGARSGLMDGEVGSLEPGKRADLILLDRDAWGFVPLTDPVRQLAFSVTSEAVRTVIVEGRVVMRDRRILTVDETALRAEVADAAGRHVRDDGPAMAAGARRLAPYLAAMYSRATTEWDRHHRDDPNRRQS